MVGKVENSEDIIANVPVYGIYSPSNFHSFQSTIKIFIPTSCEVCSQSIFPLVDAYQCLRCGVLSHRSCCNSHAPCTMFTFNDGSAKESTSGHVSAYKSRVSPRGSLRKIDSKKSADPAEEEDYDSAFWVRLDHIAEKACMIPTVLGHIPPPQTQYCIWKSILRAVAMRNNNLQDRPLDIEPEMSDEDIEQLVLTYLEDFDCFPAQVAHVCLHVFPSLNFTDLDSTISHARECLDAVVCAFLAISKRKLLEDRRVLSLLSNAVDRKLLSMHGRVIYEKVYCKLAEYSREVVVHENTDKVDTKAFPHKWKSKCVRYAEEMASKVACNDKLDVLIRLMQYIVVITSKEKKIKKSCGEVAAESGREGGRESEGGIVELDSRESEEIMVDKPSVSDPYIMTSPTSEDSKAPLTLSLPLPTHEDYVTLHDGEQSSKTPYFHNDTADSDDEDGSGIGWQTFSANVAAHYENYAVQEEEDGDGDDAMMVCKEAAGTEVLVQVLEEVIYAQHKERVVDWVAECRYLDSPMCEDSQDARGYALATVLGSLRCLVKPR
ncbi:hypothetical protein EON65_04535 [archaeon]|nr:MAG: hypothetical protein EON65_04535 [archaeon]